MKRPRIFYARFRLGEWLMRLGAWVEPDYRYRTTRDADSITLTPVPPEYT